MKWLRYALSAIGGLLVLAVIVLLVMGGGRGESRHEASVEIAKPAPAVFTWITRPEKVKSWVSWLVDIRELTPDRNGVGARQVWTMEDRNNGNQRMDIESEIMRFEQDRVLETRVAAREGFTGAISYELQPVDPAHTRLVYTASFKYEHWLAKLLSPLISRSAQQKLQEDLARLKQHAEAE